MSHFPANRELPERRDVKGKRQKETGRIRIGVNMQVKPIFCVQLHTKCHSLTPATDFNRKEGVILGLCPVRVQENFPPLAWNGKQQIGSDLFNWCFHCCAFHFFPAWAETNAPRLQRWWLRDGCVGGCSLAGGLCCVYSHFSCLFAFSHPNQSPLTICSIMNQTNT